MFRALCVAVALAMTPAGASAQTASELQIPPGWEFIQLKEWMLFDRADDGLVFVMAARQPLHIWVRTELKTASPSGTRSYRQLVQVDCAAGRTRTVSVVYFFASNLEAPHLWDDEAENWEYPAPGTRGEIPLDLLCD